MAPKGVKKIMRDLMKKMGRVSAPLLVHLGITSAAAYIGIMMYMVLGYRETDDAVLTVFSAVCCFPALWWMWKRDRGGSVIFVEKETIAEGKTSVEKKKRPVWFYAGAVCCGVLTSCLGSFLMERSGITRYFSNEVQEGLFAGNLMVQVIGFGLIVPVVEELLFRGLFYERLREFLPRYYAIFCTAAVFALYHGNPIQMIYAFPMALLLQMFYELDSSLTAPVLFHMGANLIAVLVEKFWI